MTEEPDAQTSDELANDESAVDRRSVTAWAGRITIVGLAVVVLGGVLTSFSKTAGVVVVLLGLFAFGLGLIALLSRLNPPSPASGRYQHKAEINTIESCQK